MRRSLCLALAALGPLLALPGQSSAPGPRPGLYALSWRVELPHLERYALTRTRTLCLGPGGALPIFGAMGALDGCRVVGVRAEGRRFGHALACPGRAAARAEAAYELTEAGFRGRVRLILGAKNMTMTEVQEARFLGACPGGTGGSAGH